MNDGLRRDLDVAHRELDDLRLQAPMAPGVGRIITEDCHMTAYLIDYDTTDRLRPATADEARASLTAAAHDGGAGVIRAEGRRCYVEGAATDLLDEQLGSTESEVADVRYYRRHAYVLRQRLAYADERVDRLVRALADIGEIAEPTSDIAEIAAAAIDAAYSGPTGAQ